MRAALIALLLLGCGYQRSSSLTPLIDATRGGDVATVRTLISHGADPNAPAGSNGWTPLLHAIHTHQVASVRALLDGGANPNLLAGDGETPLMMAAGYGYTDIVQLLLSRGADPKIAAPDGVRALDLAVVGTPDIDRFTLFQCHDDTVAALRAAAPSMTIGGRALAWAKVKHCRV